MKFYKTIIQDISSIRKNLDKIELCLNVADKQNFIDLIYSLEQKIKKVKDKCNEENDI